MGFSFLGTIVEIKVKAEKGEGEKKKLPAGKHLYQLVRTVGITKPCCSPCRLTTGEKSTPQFASEWRGVVPSSLSNF
jgi:hypothetical protein